MNQQAYTVDGDHLLDTGGNVIANRYKDLQTGECTCAYSDNKYIVVDRVVYLRT